jgi:hypothetical protein
MTELIPFPGEYLTQENREKERWYRWPSGRPPLPVRTRTLKRYSSGRCSRGLQMSRTSSPTRTIHTTIRSMP